MDIVEALGARSGVVCVVGAGGKKTTLYRLGRLIERAVVTATVRIPIFDDEVARVVVTADPEGALEAHADRASADDADEQWPLGLVPERERDDRYRGYDPETIDALESRIAPEGDPESLATVALVKADGARTRWLKAPNEREPRLPRRARTVIPIASARVVGEPLDEEHVHRPERVADVTGLDPGEPVTPTDVAAVLAGRDAGLKDLPPDATAVPLVNMIDTPELAATGREIAQAVLARTDPETVPRVVLARMVADDPLVGVVER